MVAEPKDEQKVTSGLPVELLSDQEGIKLHITIALLQKSIRALLKIILPICEAGLLASGTISSKVEWRTKSSTTQTPSWKNRLWKR